AQVAQNIGMTNIPSTTLPIAGRTGTLYNWLGRSCYPADDYLKKTMIYGFQLLKVELTSSDLIEGYGSFEGIAVTLDKLNAAYAENPNYTAPELATEADNLSLGDLTAVTSNLTLPTKGTLDQSISISWKSTNPGLISESGVVTRPNYYSYNDTLTATLAKNGQKLFKSFPATVVVKEGTQFTNNLLVKYDFSTVADSVVTDAAEKHLTGTLKNKASIKTIGNTVKYNVLNLGDSIGYFDMGPEVGKLMYNLTDYTVGAYFRIDSTYSEASLASNGNFLWNFSNSSDILTTPTGYIIGSLKNQACTITPTNWTPEQTVAFLSPALRGGWHHFAYTQSGTTGTVYVDGMATSGTVTMLPSTALAKSNQLGTLYNWIGRSCYTGDVYLRKTLVYDFRLYKTALTDEQIQTSVLNVGPTISALDVAYAEKPNAVSSLANNQYKVVTTAGTIKISGLNGTENVSLFDISGRQIHVTNPTRINANAGVYIVKINNEATKVVVR
ncbi:MAG TPA: immunoglobulin-like domain-containing protein, partial [Paludibacter sp.]|nr:immunoglobulin-like domain-containing protein [Paludibacter sp.]